MKELKTEEYKGRTIKFVEKIIGPNNKVVTGSYPSMITGKIIGDHGKNKEEVYMKCKRMIDKEYKIKGLN